MNWDIYLFEATLMYYFAMKFKFQVRFFYFIHNKGQELFK